MAFEAIIGQEKITDILAQALETGKLSHAYLIEGLRGSGKKTIAREFAMGIVCTHYENKPCHSCQSCIKNQHGNHPEVNWIEEDGSIKIERIRDIQKEMLMKPYEGNRKVFILCHAETMTVQAQNALLKTLEEPPSYGILILLTNNINSLLPTIVSRCQILKLRPVESHQIESFLEEKKGVAKETAKVIAAFSNGNVGKALLMLEDDEFKNRRDSILEITRMLTHKNMILSLEKAQFFTDEKNHIEELLDILTSWYRDLLVFKETQDFQFVMNYDKIEEIKSQSKQVSLKQLRDVIFMIDKAKLNLKSNVNYQLNFEVMLLNIQEVLSW